MDTKEEFLEKLTLAYVKDIINEGIFWCFDVPNEVSAQDIIEWIKKNG